ncbi:MAG TPA: MFS transporter, partial [Edaphobacter sp.]
MGLSIYFFLFNLFLIGHGYTEKTLGLLTSAMAIGNLAGAIPAGKLAQRFGLRPILLACFLLASVVFSARAILLPFPWQISLAFLGGVTLSAWAICLAPAVAQLTDERQRPFAFSLVFSLGIGVGALGGFVGSRLPGWLTSHHILFQRLQPDQLVLLCSCGIVALGLWPVTKLAFKHAPLPKRTRPFLAPGLLRLLPAIAIWSLVTGSFSPFANVYFARHLRMSL